MATTRGLNAHLESAAAHLAEHGYAIVEGVLSRRQLEDLRNALDELWAQERAAPFEPDDGPASAEDAAIQAASERRPGRL